MAQLIKSSDTVDILLYIILECPFEIVLELGIVWHFKIV